jgi:hypothetical protein
VRGFYNVQQTTSMSYLIGQYLSECVEEYNTKECDELFTEESASRLGTALTKLPSVIHQDSWSRISQIGKPTILTAIKKLENDFGVNKPAPVVVPGVIVPEDEVVSDFTPRMQSIFLWGNVFEEWVIMVGETLGWWKVIETQTRVEYEGMVGHTDAILWTPEGEFVMECKTMSPNYHRKFTKFPDDERGYVSQLGLYSLATGLPGFWLVLDKATGVLSVVTPDPDYTSERVTRAVKVFNHIRDNVVDIPSLVKTIPVPPPTPEIFRRSPTGCYLVPDTMKYSPYVDVFYTTEKAYNQYKKPTTYVTGLRDEDEVIDLLTQLLIF